jgi:Concanavalin A-like lectin/glucanases superfamily
MKFLKAFFSLSLLYVLLLGGGSQFSACKKEIIHDTLIVRDTVTIIDSICHLNDGLIAYYNFNNGSLKDSSGNNNHIIFSNATKTTDRFGRANNAYLFDGSSSYMKVANSASLNPTTGITLMATIKIKGYYSDNCVGNQVFGKGWNDFINGFYVMRFVSTVGCNNTVDTSKEVFYGAYGDLNSRASVGDNSVYIQTNKWYNVVYVYGDGQCKIYIDGVLKNTVEQSAVLTPNDQELYIGKHGDPLYPYWFNGVIDEIRIYNKALCAESVKQLYNLKQ